MNKTIPNSEKVLWFQNCYYRTIIEKVMVSIEL